MPTTTEERWATGSPRYLRAPDEGAGAGAGGTPPGSGPLAPGGTGAQPPPGQGANGAGNPPPSSQGDGEQHNRSGSVVLPQSAMKRIKQEAEERGQRRAQEAMAKEFGFSTFVAMKEHFAHKPAERQEHREDPPPEDREQRRGNGQGDDRNKGKGNQDRGGNDNRSDRREMNRWDRDRERLTRDKDVLARKMAMEVRQRKALQEQLDAKEAEMALREIAVSKGVKDIDYAVRLLTRHLEGMSEEEIAKLDGGKAFDEGKFFEGLRTTNPYLFAEVTKPANTGTGAGNAPPPPKPGAAAAAQQQGNQVDAKKMSREEFQEHLRKRGLSVGL